MNLGPLATSVLAAASLGTFSADSQVTVTNRTQFHDTEGNVIHAHGGGLLKSAEFHYWYGEHRDGDNLSSEFPATARPTWPAGSTGETC